MSNKMLLAMVLGCFVFTSIASAAEVKTLIKNVEVFNGKSEKTTKGDVLVVGKFISKISEQPLTADKDTTVIDGKGKFLMPGLIDAHYHVVIDQIAFTKVPNADANYLTICSVKSARDLLMRGFTTIRDVGFNSLSLKKAIDEGIVIGPRMYVAGAMISQTGGHGDYFPVSYMEKAGHVAIADGVDQILHHSRKQLRDGAVMLKVAVGGGVASMYDPLDVVEYTREEIAAAVSAAENWGTFVCVHVYNDKGIIQSVEAGVKVIEHGHLLTEPVAKMLAEKGIWVSTQVFLNDEDASDFPKEHPSYLKQIEMTQCTSIMYPLLKKYNVKTAWGTDLVFNPNVHKRHGAQIVKLKNWYTNFEALKMVTATNGELLKLCGVRNPYPHTIGVIEEGAYADMLLVDGNVLQNLELVADPDKNFLIIIKDGVIYKNTL